MLCRLKIHELKGNGGIGFIDPYIVNDFMLEKYPKIMEDEIHMFLTKQFHCSDILFPYKHG